MKYIVDIKGEIEGDYEIIGKYEERPQGKWNVFEYCGETCYMHKCSNEVFKANYHFCPNCGANMRKDGAE